MTIKDIIKAVVIVGIVDLCAIVLLLDYAIPEKAQTSHNEVVMDNDEEKSDPGTNAEEFLSKITAIRVEESEWANVEGDYSKNQNLLLRDIFNEHLIGSHKVENNAVYEFHENGTFNGFFDAIDSSVENYLYEIIVTDGDAVLNIYDPDKTVVVTYEISMTNADQVMLRYSSSKYKVILK